MRFRERLLVLLAFLAAPTFATPFVVRFPANFKDSSGVPQAVTKDVQLKMYEAATGGSAVWTSPVYTLTSVSDGSFVITVNASTGTPTSLLQATIALGDSVALPWFELILDSGAVDGAMTTAQTVKPRMRSPGSLFALSSYSANGLRSRLLSTAAPTNAQTLAWINSTSKWTPTSPAAVDSTFSIVAARRTTSSMNLFVRTDGNDSTCNGTANAASASAPACAFATPQKALDTVPDIVLHAVTVNVVAGTYRSSTAGSSLLRISKMVSPSASLLVQSSGGSVVFSGATSGAPTTSVGKYGVEVLYPTRGLRVVGITSSYFTDAGVTVRPSASAALESVTASANAGYGAIAEKAYMELNAGNLVFNSNSKGGLLVSGGVASLSGATVQASGNTLSGLMVLGQGYLTTGALTAVTTNTNVLSGVYVGNQGLIHGSANFISNSNSVSGYEVLPQGVLVANGTLVGGSNSAIGMDVNGSWVELNGNGTFASNAAVGVRAYDRGRIEVNKGLTISGAASWMVSLSVDYGGFFLLNNNGADAVSITGTAGTWQGVTVGNKGFFKKRNSGSVTVSTYQNNGIVAYNGGTIIDEGTGTRTISGVGVYQAWMSELSLYRRGQFPVQGSCDSMSRCN